MKTLNSLRCETRTIAPSRDYQAEGQSSTGRQSKRTGPGGVEQTGTQAGIKPMTIDDVNSALGRIAPTTSLTVLINNLPATADYEFEYWWKDPTSVLSR